MDIVKRLLKATVFIWDPVWIFLYRIRYRETRPIPPFQNRDRIGARYINWFLHSGEENAEVLKTNVQIFVDTDLSDLHILDFGAGCGRILQHFTETKATLYATDVDASAIKYLQGAYPQIRSQHNASVPPLDIPNQSLDVVYAYSVWTHLPLDKQLAWLDEMQRILKPNGLLLITFLGFYGLQLLRESNAPLEAEWALVSEEQLHAEGQIYKEYTIFSENTETFSGITDSYGLAVHNPDYIRSTWGTQFDILKIQPRALHNHQDLVVMRNR